MTDSLMFTHPLVRQIVGFLTDIGLPVRRAPLGTETFLPGIAIEGGGLVVDEERLLYPGDLLHEAGHLAVTPSAERARADGNLNVGGGEEMAAIGWSYAAALHLGIDPAIVFHSHGYHEGSESLLENFQAGRYLGVPLLQWMGLTLDAKAAARGGEAYPKMIRWLRG